MLRILGMRAYVKGEQTKLKFLSKKEVEEGKHWSNPHDCSTLTPHPKLVWFACCHLIAQNLYTGKQFLF